MSTYSSSFKKLEKRAEASLKAKKERSDKQVEKEKSFYFVASSRNIKIKGDMCTMLYPFFSLSKKPDMNVFEFKHKGTEIIITPSKKGRANILDKEILMFFTSQIIDALDRGEAVSRNIEVELSLLLSETSRGNSGKSYINLKSAIERLAGTKVETNIKMDTALNDNETFKFITDWELIEKRMLLRREK